MSIVWNGETIGATSAGTADVVIVDRGGTPAEVPLSALVGPAGPTGPVGQAGQTGAPGATGANGIGISAVTQTAQGHIVFTVANNSTLTNGETIDIGAPVGASGICNGTGTFIASGTTYAMAQTDFHVTVRRVQSAPMAITLPGTAYLRQEYTIKDQRGDAGTNNITISDPGGYLIDGNAHAVINQGYGALSLYLDTDGSSYYWSIA